ncbi:MAG: 1-acyl-sn-glycerol-3-phosphate acyltransferase [Sulfurimonas sp.]|nr:1-acyl-sn-glycerol-3-phosphate acyltransferase [Sulfurimonas sp.]
MDLHKIENKILSLSPFVKEIEVVMQDDFLFAYIYPDFQELKKANIINIEDEIRWYGVELYNMEVEEAQKVRGYKILTRASTKVVDEPNDEIYKILKAYISTISDSEVSIDSHLELDIGLDSLNYVELFTFIEQSFGVEIDEVIFSKIMVVEELYKYIKNNQTHIDPVTVKWEEILDEEIDEKLVYSPFIMSIYKSFMLPIFRLYFRLEVIGKENIPSYPCIIAPSHQSMLDGFLIEATLPYKVLKKSFFLAYKQVFGRSILEPISKHGQSILIDANEHLRHTIQYTSLPLKEGNNLVIFPEGARSRDRKLLEFRPFFAMLSKTFNIPVVPVVIDGSFEALGTGKLFPRPKKIRVTYLKPINPEGLTSHELTVRVKEAIESEMKRNPIF